MNKCPQLESSTQKKSLAVLSDDPQAMSTSTRNLLKLLRTKWKFVSGKCTPFWWKTELLASLDVINKVNQHYRQTRTRLSNKSWHSVITLESTRIIMCIFLETMNWCNATSQVCRKRKSKASHLESNIQASYSKTTQSI